METLTPSCLAGSVCQAHRSCLEGKATGCPKAKDANNCEVVGHSRVKLVLHIGLAADDASRVLQYLQACTSLHPGSSWVVQKGSSSKSYEAKLLPARCCTCSQQCSRQGQHDSEEEASTARMELVVVIVARALSINSWEPAAYPVNTNGVHCSVVNCWPVILMNADAPAAAAAQLKALVSTALECGLKRGLECQGRPSWHSSCCLYCCCSPAEPLLPTRSIRTGPPVRRIDQADRLCASKRSRLSQSCREARMIVRCAPTLSRSTAASRQASDEMLGHGIGAEPLEKRCRWSVNGTRYESIARVTSAAAKSSSATE